MPIRTTARRFVALNALALAGGLAACSSDSITSGKGADVPAAAVNTVAQQVGAITNDPTVVALFGPVLSGSGFTAPTASRTGDAGALFTRLAGQGARALKLGGSSASALRGPRFTVIGTTDGMSIPAEMFGHTYVHDDGNNYVVDDTATGAPDNGFRLMLYPWNADAPAGQQWGATAIGYADVMDEGTTGKQKIVVDMYAIGGANPVIAFKVVDATTDAGQADTLAGTVNAAGGKTMSYEFASLTTGIGTATERDVTKMHVDVPGSNFQIEGTLIDGLQAGDEQLVSAKIGSDVVTFSIGTQLVDGEYTTSDTTSIEVNGRLAGYLIDNATGNTRLVRPDGSEMSNEQKIALANLVMTFNQVFFVIGVTTLFALWAIALGMMI